MAYTWLNGVVSGGAYKSVYSGGFGWDLISQDIANNTSTIDVAIWLMKDVDYNFYNLYDRTSRYVIDGTTYNFTSRVDMRTSSGVLQDVRQVMEADGVATAFPKCVVKRVTITHNADGTRTVPIETFLNCNDTSDHVTNVLTNATITLPTIPRASQPTLTDNNIEFGESFTINTNRASGSFTHKLKYTFGGEVDVLIADGVGASAVWTPSNSLAGEIPTSKVGSGIITCETYNGTTLIGTKTVAFTLNIPASWVPVLSSGDVYFTLVNNPNPASLIGYAIQNVSELGLHLDDLLNSLVAAYGTTLTHYQVAFDTYTPDAAVYTNAAVHVNAGVIKTWGTKFATFKVKDARGNWSNTLLVQVKGTGNTIYKYSEPADTGFNVFRRSSDLTKADYTMSFTAMALGGANTWTYQRQRYIGGVWQNVDASPVAISVVAVNDVYTYTATLVNDTYTYAEDTVYSLRVVLVDKLSTKYITDSLPTSDVPFALSDKGAAAGKIPTATDIYDFEFGDGGFWSQGDAKIDGKILSAQRRATYLNAAADADTILEEWVLAGQGTGSTNFPTSPTLEWWYLQTIQYSDTRRMQVAYAYARNEIWRRYQGTTWSAWVKIYPQSSALDAYPVGSVFISVLPTSPATLIGGTWARIAHGRVLVGQYDSDTRFDTAEETGGSYTHYHAQAVHDHPAGELFAHMNLSSNSRVYAAKAAYSWTGNPSSYVQGSANVQTVNGDVNTQGVIIGGSTGNSAAVNTGSADNIMPYLVVYMWKRTA